MSKCCACGGPLSKGSVSGWKVLFMSVAVLFPLGIALYNCTKWLDTKAKIKKVRGNYREELEKRSELLLIEKLLKEDKIAAETQDTGKGDGPSSVEMWGRNMLNTNP